MGRDKRPADPRGGHVRIYWEIIDSMAWRALAYSSQSLYVALRRKLKGTNNGNISAALGDMKHYGWRSPTTLANGLRELQAVGLIEATRQGGIARGEKFCSLYRFTDEPVFEHPKLGIAACKATNEWRQYTTLKDAENAIQAAHEAVKKSKNKCRIQNLYRATTESVVVNEITDTDSVVVRPSLLQILEQAKPPKKRLTHCPH